MNFKHISDETKEKIIAFTISGILIVTFYVLMNHIPVIGTYLIRMVKAISPFLIGILFTFIMLPLRRLLEDKWLIRMNIGQRNRRKIAVMISMILFILLIIAFFLILIPQLFDSIKVFIDSMSGYIKTIQSLVEKLNAYNPELADYLEKLVSTTGSTLNTWLTGAQGGMARILNYSIGFAKGIMNFFVGLFISMYLLYDEEKFKKQIKMVVFGFLNERTAEDILHLMRLTKTTFNKFIFGKFIDSLIIGILCYIGCLIMRVPYSPMIAVVIGITNMIPVFGPFIGAIPCIFILLIINPLKSMEFMVFVLVLQQIDGNIIGPQILGDAVGLPTLWVMFAIIVGGSLFGIVGMFVGVPLFSVIYSLTEERVHNNLASRKIDIANK